MNVWTKQIQCLLEISVKQMCTANVWPCNDIKRWNRSPLCYPDFVTQTLCPDIELVSGFHDTYSDINPWTESPILSTRLCIHFLSLLHSLSEAKIIGGRSCEDLRSIKKKKQGHDCKIDMFCTLVVHSNQNAGRKALNHSTPTTPRPPFPIGRTNEWTTSHM